MTAIVTHSTPAWRAKSDFLIRVDLADSGLPETMEQIWARKIGHLTFEVCCIPFFAYGLALGDTVQCNCELVMQKRLASGGHNTLRVVIADFASSHQIHEAIHGWVVATGMLHEWHSPGYLAIDLPPAVQGKLDTSLLDDLCRLNSIEIEFTN